MTNGEPRSRAPTHRLYRVVGAGLMANWIPIGAAWPTTDGLGFNVSCDLVPLQGRIVLRVIDPGDSHSQVGRQP